MVELWESNHRIPEWSSPLHYDVYLHPDLESARFSGKTNILVECHRDFCYLVVHVKHLDVTSAAVTDTRTGEIVDIERSFEYGPNEFWVLILKDQRPPGVYRISMTFNGLLDNGIVGFYKSVYDGHKAIATSKFQPTYARRCFPCFDEPSFKSTFTVTLVKPSGGSYWALSNMPVALVKQDSPREGLDEVTFQKSVPMVTYLAVFVVADFGVIEAKTPATNIPFRVFGTEHQLPLLKYALDVGIKIADFYASYFDVKYPLPKLDMAAIPDYSSGATEHWGLITFRETNLVYQPGKSSAANKQRVVTVIAHELAHQWFGNLVTVKWWNDLWLNEGFASYIEYKGMSCAEPDMDTESLFLLDDLYRVFDFDATFASHPIVVNVNTPDQITSVFDVISYCKGASVIRMMESFLGPEVFRLGISNFLKKFEFKNAVTQDLLDELAKVSRERIDVVKVINTWTRQKGYPVLCLERDGNSYKVRQERFLTDADADPSQDEKSPFDYKWDVPVTFISSANKERTQVWLHSHDDDGITINVPSDAKWIKFNVEQRGYYRVNYPESDWGQFLNVLQTNPDALSISDRTNLLEDAFSLAAAGRLPYKVALDLTTYMPGKETALAPWDVVIEKLSSISAVLSRDDETKRMLLSYQRELIASTVASLGWKDGEGSVDTQLLRSKMLEFACACEHSESLEMAGHKFELWLAGQEEVEPNLKVVVYRYGINKVTAPNNAWLRVFDKFTDEHNAQEKLKILQGLASIQDVSTITKLIEVAKDESAIRGQDYFTLLSMISRNKAGNSLVWKFLRTEWSYLVKRFTLNDRLFARFIVTVTEKFSTEEKLDEMQTFFDANPEAGAGEQSRKMAIAQVKNNIKFVSKYESDIKTWLSSK